MAMGLYPGEPPFGTKTASSAASALTLRRTGSTVTLRDAFSGKEDQQPDFGVPWLDFGARAYSPALRRWMVPAPPRGEVLRGKPLRLLQRGSGELRGSVNINEHEPADSCVNRLGDFVFPGQVSIVDHWGRNPRPVLQGNLHWRRMQRHRIDGLRDF